MELGAFSVSLSVQDLDASRAFYEALGFQVLHAEEGWMILRSGEATIGLFQGMFDGNLLTFNPRMSPDVQLLPDAPDVRDIHDAAVTAGLPVDYSPPADGGDDPMGGDRGSPASFIVTDPDGNRILFDQFQLG